MWWVQEAERGGFSRPPFVDKARAPQTVSAKGRVVDRLCRLYGLRLNHSALHESSAHGTQYMTSEAAFQ